MFKKMLFATAILLSFSVGKAQSLALTPPMGFMSWNYFATAVNEKDLIAIANSMVENGMVDLGYKYICIDDGWQGGRDSMNNIIANPKKFPHGIKYLADYLHQRGMKLGIYSDAAPLTCAGYTGSLHFEDQDAKTFASWGVDYLKYDYCGAPPDRATAEKRYRTMADALRKSGRDIAFAICEWGGRQPWLWAAEVGGQLWRTTGDIRDKWKNIGENGEGIIDNMNVTAELPQYAGIGHWNDPDMLVVGLYGKKGPSGDLGGVGCTDVEYQSQMSLWCLMASPLMITCDIRRMNDATKKILLNKDIIAIDQDGLGKQAIRKVKNDDWDVFVKSLENGDVAVGVLNLTNSEKPFKMSLSELGLDGKYTGFDVWSKQKIKKTDKLEFKVASHETKVIRLSK